MSRQAAIPEHSRHSGPHRGGQAGFTLVELLIVLTILVVASGFVIMNLDGVTSEGRLRSAGRDLANHLKYARGFAIVTGKPMYMYYDRDESAYYLTRCYYGEERGAPRHEELRTVEHRWDLPRGIRLHSVVSTIKTAERFIERFDFTPFGASVSHSVFLKGPDEDEWLTVEVNGLTGHVAIHKYYKEFDSVAETLPGL